MTMKLKPPVNLVELDFSLERAERPAAAGAAFAGDPIAVSGLLSAGELERLNAELDRHPWTPVGSNGILEDYVPGAERNGSWRLTVHSQEWADELWRRVAPLVGEEPRRFDRRSQTDWEPHASWRAVGVNPRLRFIRYRNGGLLVPHYDAPVEIDGRRTLVTLVIYLRYDEGVAGGETRFIRDPQREVAIPERDLADWKRLANPDEIERAVLPRPGEGLLFDHRILHDSAQIAGPGEKIIIRTDIFYEPVEEG